MADRELAQGWFHVRELEPGVHAIEEPLHAENVASFLIQGEDRALLVDAGTGVGDFAAVVAGLTNLPVTLLVSHSHWDHVGCADQFALDCPVLVHPLEAERLRAGVSNERMREFFAPDQLHGPLPEGTDLESLVISGVEPTGMIEDGDQIDLGGRLLQIVHVPGHSPGLLALLDRESGMLITTDAIYGGALYAHLPGVDFPAYQKSAARLGALEPMIRNVYASHNDRRLDPSILGRVVRAFADIADGREPDAIESDVARHEFDGFSVLRPAEEYP